MDRARVGGLFGTMTFLAVLAGAGAFAGCASTGGGGGVSLSQGRYSADDLQRASNAYETVYDLLRAHRRVSVRNVGGREVLLVEGRAGRARGGVAGERRTGGAVLVVDGARRADVIMTVKQLSLTDVESLRILRPEQAGQQGYADDTLDIGAIVIDTKGGAGS